VKPSKVSQSSTAAPTDRAGDAQTASSGYHIDDLSDMLVELRVLLPGAQLLAAFLITLPFMPGFRDIAGFEKWVFAATLICSIFALILLSAPAVQHRLMWPLPDRVAFKRFASYEMLAGAAMLSLALVLGVNLVVSVVFGPTAGIVVGGLVAIVLGLTWWVLPLVIRRQRARRAAGF
jgi:hypothetical protein